MAGAFPEGVLVSPESLSTAGVLLITVPAVAFGGVSLLTFIYRDIPGYLDNPMRQRLFRAGHAHAGVLVAFALLGMLYVDQAGLGEGARALVRAGLVLPPILMPAGFFFSVTSPRATEPNRLILLVYAGGAILAAATLTLGLALAFS